jgi:hypothetical protein
MIDCRKVLFLEFERKYDISDFRNPENQKGLFGPFSDAPYYSRNPEYILKSVTTPFDYIVLDHAHIQNLITSEGVDPQIFWNIWRLTPQVYRFPNAYGSPPNEWYIKEDFQKSANTTEDNASYVLEQSMDVALHLNQRRKRERVSGHKSTSVILKREGVDVYEKADRDGPVSAKTPPGVRQLETSFRTIGLNGVDHYWSVWRMHKEAEGKLKFLSGFVHADDVETTSEEFGGGVDLRGPA